jgi:hypothetical protein
MACKKESMGTSGGGGRNTHAFSQHPSWDGCIIHAVCLIRTTHLELEVHPMVQIWS